MQVKGADGGGALSLSLSFAPLLRMPYLLFHHNHHHHHHHHHHHYRHHRRHLLLPVLLVQVLLPSHTLLLSHILLISHTLLLSHILLLPDTLLLFNALLLTNLEHSLRLHLHSLRLVYSLAYRPLSPLSPLSRALRSLLFQHSQGSPDSQTSVFGERRLEKARFRGVHEPPVELCERQRRKVAVCCGK